MAELDAGQLRESKLAGRIDQLIGWAKSGKTREYYVMCTENVDRLRNDIIDVIAAEIPSATLGAIFPATLRQQVQQARNDYSEEALGHYGSGELTAEAYANGHVKMCDEVLGWLAGTPAPGEGEQDA